MDWIMVSTVTGTGLAIILSLFTGFRFMYNEMRSIEDKLDKKIDMQAARSDKLYEMFIDLLKDRK